MLRLGWKHKRSDAMIDAKLEQTKLINDVLLSTEKNYLMDGWLRDWGKLLI